MRLRQQRDCARRRQAHDRARVHGQPQPGRFQPRLLGAPDDRRASIPFARAPLGTIAPLIRGEVVVEEIRRPRLDPFQISPDSRATRTFVGMPEGRRERGAATVADRQFKRQPGAGGELDQTAHGCVQRNRGAGGRGVDLDGRRRRMASESLPDHPRDQPFGHEASHQPVPPPLLERETIVMRALVRRQDIRQGRRRHRGTADLEVPRHAERQLSQRFDADTARRS